MQHVNRSPKIVTSDNSPNSNTTQQGTGGKQRVASSKPICLVDTETRINDQRVSSIITASNESIPEIIENNNAFTEQDTFLESLGGKKILFDLARSIDVNKPLTINDFSYESNPKYARELYLIFKHIGDSSSFCLRDYKTEIKSRFCFLSGKTLCDNFNQIKFDQRMLCFLNSMETDACLEYKGFIESLNRKRLDFIKSWIRNLDFFYQVQAALKAEDLNFTQEQYLFSRIEEDMINYPVSWWFDQSRDNVHVFRYDIRYLYNSDSKNSEEDPFYDLAVSKIKSANLKRIQFLNRA